jgi:hypothetical protein
MRIFSIDVMLLRFRCAVVPGMWFMPIVKPIVRDVGFSLYVIMIFLMRFLDGTL